MSNIDFQKLSIEIHQNAKAKGFWDSQRNVGELFMLIVSELGEALEAHRKGRFAKLEWLEFELGQNTTMDFEQHWNERFSMFIKDTFEDEIADTVIRILDYVGWRGDLEIDLEYYEQLGDFRLFDENIGEVLMEVTGFVFKAFKSAKTLAYISTEHELGILEEKINAALILLVNLSDECGFDLSRHIEAKIKYNSTRERLHGKSY